MWIALYESYTKVAIRKRYTKVVWASDSLKWYFNLRLNQCSATPRAKRVRTRSTLAARARAKFLNNALSHATFWKLSSFFFHFFLIFSCFDDINYFEKFLYLNKSFESWQKFWREVISNSDWVLILSFFAVTILSLAGHLRIWFSFSSDARFSLRIESEVSSQVENFFHTILNWRIAKN